MRLTRTLCLAVPMVVVALSPGRAITLDAGTYKLQWAIPGPKEAPSGYCSARMRTLPADEAARYEGLRSGKCYRAMMHRMTVLLDESKGTGQGYDVAYVTAEQSGASRIDLKQAARIPLKLNRDVLESDRENPVRVNVEIGEYGSMVTKQADVMLSVRFAAGPSGQGEPTAYTTLRGGWSGTIKTDAGPVDVQLLDQNSNGIYGDLLAVEPGLPFFVPADMLLIRGSGPNRPSKRLGLAKVVECDGKLYSIALSKTGDALTIEPYTGGTGSVKVEATDGYGKPAECRSMTLVGESAVYDLLGGGGMKLPVGEYRVLEAQVTQTDRNGPEAGAFGVAVYSRLRVKVEKDAEAAVKIGGPMKLEIEPDIPSIAAERERPTPIALVFTVGGSQLVEIDGDRSAQIKIADAGGKVLQTGEASIGTDGRCVYSLEIPKAWKPGTYKVTASFDPTPYQGPITAEKELKIAG